MTQTETVPATAEAIAAAVAAADFGKPSAVKRGRNPRWPYVPILVYADRPLAPTSQIKGKAFVTRDEAVAYAAKVVDHQRVVLARNLADRGHRALREQHGLDRELPS